MTGLAAATHPGSAARDDSGRGNALRGQHFAPDTCFARETLIGRHKLKNVSRWYGVKPIGVFRGVFRVSRVKSQKSAKQALFAARIPLS
jgi:hypothetical protein